MRNFVDSATAHVISEDQPVPPQWHVTGLIMLLTGLSIVGLFWPTIRAMVEVWESSRTFAHGFLVLPATGYLIWCYRNWLIPLIPISSAYGFVMLVLAGSGWFLGYQLNLVWFQQASVVMMLPGLVWAILGTDILMILLWPLGFLVFMLPVGTSIEPWLQDFTAWLILVGLKITGIPYLYENHLITLSSGTWDVAPDCGGLRYLLPGLALGYAFATLFYRQSARRLTFLAVCAVVLMLANGVRAYGVIVGDHIGIAKGTDHRVFSYTIYSLTILLLYWLGLKWVENKTVPLFRDRKLNPPYGHDNRRTVFIAIVALGLLAVAPFSVWMWGGIYE